MGWKACFCGIILLLQMLPGAVAGQQAITLQEAIHAGLANHYGLRIARNDATVASENVTPGNAGMLPRLSAVGEWDKASLNAKVNTSVGARIDRESAAVSLISAGLQAQWTLFDGTAMFLEYERLKSYSSLASLTLQEEMEEAIHDISGAYFDMVRQQRMLEFCRQQLDVSHKRSALATENFRSGAGSELEMIQAEVTRLADSTAFTQQQTALQKAGLNLNKLMAADLRQQLIPADTLTLLELPPPATIVENALRSNTGRLNAGEIYHLRELELKMARAKKLPRLTLNGAYRFTENETEASLINYTKTLGPYVGINASLPLFDGLTLNQEVIRAETSLENQAIRIAEMEQELTALVLEAWYDHQTLIQLTILGRKRCLLAEKTLTIARTGYSAGSVSPLQLREAQTGLFEAQANLTDAIFQARVMESALLKISGELIKTTQTPKNP